MIATKHAHRPGFLIKIVFLVLVSLWLDTALFAQTELSKVNSYGSLAAVPGEEAMLNIEVRINSSENLTWYGRAGLGWGGILLVIGGPGVLSGITMLTGKGNSHLEVSGGVFCGSDIIYDDSLFILPSLDLGYRFQKPDGGVIFKAKAGILGVGFGLGYAF